MVCAGPSQPVQDSLSASDLPAAQVFDIFKSTADTLWKKDNIPDDLPYNVNGKRRKLDLVLVPVD